MHFKIAFYLVGLSASYIAVLTSSNLWLSLLYWSLLGLFAAFSALNICHDAIHGSISSRQSVNRFFSSFFNVLGANDYVWKYAHNMVHHSYTNVQGHDEDVDAIPFVRTSPHQKLRFFHRYQQFYAVFLYSLATISWVFVKDFVKMAKGKIGETKMPQTPVEIRRLVIYKLVYYTIFLVLPLLILPLSIPQILAGFLLMHFFEGTTIAVIFMLAHLVEDVDFPLPDEGGSLENNWAVHQLVTTANFAPNSKLVGFLTGGLNFQVEHHLFPDMCHVHYPEICKIVQQTAEEYSLPYNSNYTLGGALVSHMKFLGAMSR